jgi:hypothetical protein
MWAATNKITYPSDHFTFTDLFSALLILVLFPVSITATQKHVLVELWLLWDRWENTPFLMEALMTLMNLIFEFSKFWKIHLPSTRWRIDVNWNVGLKDLKCKSVPIIGTDKPFKSRNVQLASKVFESLLPFSLLRKNRVILYFYLTIYLLSNHY